MKTGLVMRTRPKRPPQDRPLRSGFTLVELMIAMVLTSMTIIGAWQFFATASRSMSIFMNLSMTDERLNFAADMIAMDARLAGMMGTPQSERDPLICPKPALVYRGVYVDDGVGIPGHNWGLNTNLAPDACTFQVPVMSSVMRTQRITGNRVFLQAGNLPATADEFDALFFNHILRVTSPSGFSQFVWVLRTNFANGSVVTVPPLTPLERNGICGVEGLGLSHEVSVLTHVQYALVEDADDPDVTNLIRQELMPDLTAIVPRSRLVIAENVVNLQCWADAFQQPDTAFADYVGTGDAAVNSAATQALRTFHFEIAGHTDREFVGYQHQPRADFDVMRTYDLDGDVTTAALGLTVSREVELTNFAVRGLQ